MKNNNKGRDIFFGLVALATLIVAIVGATLAYFSVMASSNEGAVGATAATVSITYSEGQEVSMNAEKLIPIYFDDLKNIYERNIIKFENGQITSSGICQDDVLTQYQVCSVYRFSVKSENSTRNITARLNNEENGFTYLSYAIYDVTNGEWVNLNTYGDKDLSLQKCTNTNNEGENAITTDDCVTPGTNNEKKYISNSIFGLDADGKFVTKELVVGIEQTYDVILFIKNGEFDQNIDQGKRYSGHIVVDVTDGAGDRIEGTYDDTK